MLFTGCNGIDFDVKNSESAQLWCEHEFSQFNCGDKRLSNRLLKISKAKLKMPTQSLNTACENWADTKGAYRFFNNDKVTVKNILAPHIYRTIERINQNNNQDFLILQDTTDIVLTHHKSTENLGKITSANTDILGFHIHTAFCINLSGEPLGILNQNYFVHKNEKNTNYKKLPIHEKESFKWMDWFPIMDENEIIKKHGIICGDRESDIFEFLLNCYENKRRFLIRSSIDRCVENEKSKKLRETLKQEKVLGERTLDLLDQKTGKLRKVQFTIQSKTVILSPPKNINKTRGVFPPTQVNVIYSREINQINKEEPLEWILYSSEPIHSLDSAWDLVLYYRQRWHIESFHRVLKSGLKIEEARLGQCSSMQKLCALCSIIAVRLYWIQQKARINPNETVEQLLSKDEWQALYCKIKRTKEFPNKVPTLNEVVRMIASLGGFLGRKGDDEPGMITIWRGWMRLQEILDDWRLFRSL